MDFWYQPRPWLMAAANASYATSGSGYSVRGAIGWRLLDLLFVGPETQILGCDDYRQYRVGLHATGLRSGDFEWSFGLRLAPRFR